MDMKLIGEGIATLRQTRQWTQRQLARQLSVSHQAVSKWEKGAAAPDLETLVTMARLFGVSVDQLLQPSKSTVQVERDDEMIEDKREDFRFEFEEENDDEVEDEYEGHDDDNDDEDEDERNDDKDGEKKPENPKLKLLMEIAPFVSREVLDEKFLQFLENNDLSDLSVVSRFAPFVSRDAVSAAIDKVIDQRIDPKIILQLAPFIAKKDLVRLMSGFEDREWISQNLSRLAPFLPREYMDDMLRNIDF